MIRQPHPTLDTYEITYVCRDDDWLSWRVPCADFHDAVEAALARLHMAGVDDTHKLCGARLHHILRIPAQA